MAALSTILIAAAVGVSAGATVHSSRTQARELKKGERRAEAAAAQARGAIEDQQRTEDLTRQRDAARARQQAAGGRQSTILTEPLGDIGQAQTAQRTLLGL